MKRVLIVAHHFPPDTAVGGVRPAKFAKYLPQFGWNPVVLTVDPTYHPTLDRSSDEKPPYTVLTSSFVRSLSHYYRRLKRGVHGTNPETAAPGTGPVAAGLPEKPSTIRDWVNALIDFPDEHTGWTPFALFTGIKAMRAERVDCVLTSGPPQSTHLLGAWLSRNAGVPWVADFRDPVYYADKANRAAQRLDLGFEAYVMKRATLVLTTTTRLSADLADRHPREAQKLRTLPNGFDPDDFPATPTRLTDKFSIAYLGSVYGRRDPTPLFQSVSTLLQEGRIAPHRIVLRFVGNFDIPMAPLIAKYGLEGIVEVSPWLPKPGAFALMTESHVLLLLAEDQALMIPAKVYDYLGTGRHILALTGEGATADLLREAGHAAVHLPHDVEGITASVAALFLQYTRQHAEGPRITHDMPSRVAKYDRRCLTKELAGLLDQLTR